MPTLLELAGIINLKGPALSRRKTVTSNQDAAYHVRLSNDQRREPYTLQAESYTTSDCECDCDCQGTDCSECGGGDCSDCDCTSDS